MGKTRTTTCICSSLPDDNITPLADEKINQIKTVGVCQPLTDTARPLFDHRVGSQQKIARCCNT